MTTAERLQSIQTSKEAIKAAIEAKGIECNDVLSTFAEKIAAIPTGGGSSEFSEYSYQVPTADEEGLRALGWDDDSIKYFKYNNLLSPESTSPYAVPDENKALKDVIIDMSTLSSNKGNPNLKYCPKFDVSSETSLNSMFSGGSYIIAVPLFDTSNAVNMSSMFYQCKNLEFIPLFDTSKVVNMSTMFYQCNKLKSVPPIDTSKVTSMSSMFIDCRLLTAIPSLDTSNVLYMAGMFNGCSNLLTIPQLDTSKVTNMSTMFQYCSALISVPKLNISKVTNISDAFYYNSSLTTLGGFTGLKVDLTLSQSTQLTHDSLMNVINEAADVTASPKTLTLGSTNLAKLTDEEKAVATGKGWTLA